MKVKIMNGVTGAAVPATIRKAKQSELPSLHDGWRFNFSKLIQKTAHGVAYVLVADENPGVIEGCLIFQLKGKIIPTMAYLEVAPHNKQDPKKYDMVAGCLIAFAYALSEQLGKGDNMGCLFFDVLEELDANRQKLLALYGKKYGAILYEENTLCIYGDAGKALLKKYLGVQ